MSEKTIRVIISGRVQGVGYRAWTVATAKSYGLSGWVRNLSDGNVETLFHGDEQLIEEMIAKCSDGPPAARVSGIQKFDYREDPPAGFFSKPTI